jgi:hypothetical protein
MSGELSAKVQQKLFSDGFSWYRGSTKVDHINENYIYADYSDMQLTWDSKNNSHYTPTDPHEFLNETLTTEPIDYTGCHPVIAKCLKNNLAVRCEGDENTFGLVINYCKGAIYPYGTKTRHLLSKNAKPVYTKKTVTHYKKASELVAWMEENATLDDDGWYGETNGEMFRFTFRYIVSIAGTKYDNNPNTIKEWLEEK